MSRARPSGPLSWTGRFRWLETRALGNALEDDDADRRKGLRASLYQGLFDSLSDVFSYSFLTLYVLALGATNAQIGIFNSIFNLCGALGLYPGATLDDRLADKRQRKWLAAFGFGGYRALMLPVAALPWLLSGPSAFLWIAALMSAAHFIYHLGLPAWTALLGDVVPLRKRGRFMSARTLALAAAGLVGTPLAGWMILQIGEPLGYQVSFIIAGLLGITGTLIFARTPGSLSRAATDVERAHSRQPLARLLVAYPAFTFYCAQTFLFYLAIWVAAPFFNVYQVEVLGGTTATVGLLTAAEYIVRIVVLRLFGGLADRWGAKRIMVSGGLLMPVFLLGWAVVDAPMQLLPVMALAGVAWSGYSVGQTNLLLELAPDPVRARFSAVLQTALLLATVVGPLIGAALVDRVGFIPLVLISSAGRLLSVLFLQFFVHPPRQAAGATAAA